MTPPHLRRITFRMPEQSWDYHLAVHGQDYYSALWELRRLISDSQRNTNNPDISSALTTLDLRAGSIMRHYGLTDENTTCAR